MIVDCLSRLPIEDDIIINTNEYINLINFELINVTFEDIAKAAKEDTDLIKLQKFIKFGFPNNAGKLTRYTSYKNELSLFKMLFSLKIEY